MIKHHTFNAITLQKDNMNAAYVEFPFSTEELFRIKGQVKVQVLFDDIVSYRGSLAKMKTESHILGLTKDIRQQLNKGIGDEIKVELWHDTEVRTVDIPNDVMVIFEENPKAYSIFQNLSFTHRKEFIRWITDAKKPETRKNRKIKLIEMILSGKKGI